MRIRPCIDLHDGKVKQIVGATLHDGDTNVLWTNFETERPASEFAALYREDHLAGGHVIMLGEGNTRAAIAALGAYPGGLQVGGGITPDNARDFLDAGASHVIVTSYVFKDGRIHRGNLERIAAVTGTDRLVLDLSCRRKGDDYVVCTDRWTKWTAVTVSGGTLSELADYCAEFLVHAVDVEGRQAGIEEELVRRLADISPRPITYAGGIRSFDDLDRIKALGAGRVDATVGSALDIFGGKLPYRDVVRWHERNS